MTKRQNNGLFTIVLALMVAMVSAFDSPDRAMASSATQAMRKAAKKKHKNNHKNKADKAPMPALKFKMKNIDGKKQNLKKYYGNVVLMVNTASKCGFTPQYEGLEKLYEELHEKGFEILAFPANNFGHQEPGPNGQIKSFCTSKYNVTFPLFAKVSVKGDDICKLYRYLTDKNADHTAGGVIPWNFTKFLINRKGEVVARFGPRTKPHDKTLIDAINKELSRTIPKDSPLAKKKKVSKPKGA